MLRTQQAQDDQLSMADIDDLCEAICLDAVEAAQAARAGIWLFDQDGAMICQRQFDVMEGGFSQGRVIPHTEAAIYLKAARDGLGASATDAAPALAGDGSKLQNRLDLLLVDSSNQPTAMFCCERAEQSGDWRERDIYVLRHLAQALGGAIRRHGEYHAAAQQASDSAVATEQKADLVDEAEADLDAAFGAAAREMPRRLH